MDISLVFAEAKSESLTLCSGGGREGSQIAEQSRRAKPCLGCGWLVAVQGEVAIRSEPQGCSIVPLCHAPAVQGQGHALGAGGHRTRKFLPWYGTAASIRPGVAAECAVSPAQAAGAEKPRRQRPLPGHQAAHSCKARSHLPAGPQGGGGK